MIVTTSYTKAYARRLQDAFLIPYKPSLELAAHALDYPSYKVLTDSCPESERELAGGTVMISPHYGRFVVSSGNYKCELPESATLFQALAHGAWLLGHCAYLGAWSFVKALDSGPSYEDLAATAKGQDGILTLNRDVLNDLSLFPLMDHPAAPEKVLDMTWKQVQRHAYLLSLKPERIDVHLYSVSAVRRTTAPLAVLARQPGNPLQVALQALNAFVPAFQDGCMAEWYPGSFSFGSRVAEALAPEFARHFDQKVASSKSEDIEREDVQLFLRNGLIELGRSMAEENAAFVRASDDLTFAVFPITDDLEAEAKKLGTQRADAY